MKYKKFRARKGYKAYVTKQGVKDNPDLELHEGLEGIILGQVQDKIRLVDPFPIYLIRFPHESVFLLRDHFVTEQEKDFESNQE